MNARPWVSAGKKSQTFRVADRSVKTDKKGRENEVGNRKKKRRLKEGDGDPEDEKTEKNQSATKSYPIRSPVRV